jgi:large subunit ribosomal protein L21
LFGKILQVFEGKSAGSGLAMVAVVRTGGKQYKVEPNTILRVEKLPAEEGQTVELTEVLLVQDDNGLRIGTPTVPNAKVVAEVVRHVKGRKIIGFTYKPKKNERRHYGHRQWQTVLRVQSIEA